MPTYGSAAGVAARLGNRPLTATSAPSTTDAGNWLDEAEAELFGAIQQGGGPASYTSGSRGALIIRQWVERYVAGLVRETHAAAGGDGSNEDGAELREAWAALLLRLRTNAENVLAMLESDGGLPTEAIGIGSHTTDGSLALTATDYGPTFKLKDGAANF